MTPPHLVPLNGMLVLNLVQRAGRLADMMPTLLRENQAFLISETPHDAGRVAKYLRYIIREAETVALAFEAAAKAKDVDNGTEPNRDD